MPDEHVGEREDRSPQEQERDQQGEDNAGTLEEPRREPEGGDDVDDPVADA